MSSILGTELRPSGLVASTLPTKHLSLFISLFTILQDTACPQLIQLPLVQLLENNEQQSGNNNSEGTRQGGTLIWNIQE